MTSLPPGARPMNERGKDDDMIEAIQRAYGGTHDPRATIRRFLEAAERSIQGPGFFIRLRDFLATYEETP